MTDASPKLASLQLPLSQLLSQFSTWQHGLMGFVCFSGHQLSPSWPLDAPSISVPAPVLLDETESVCEGWLVNADISYSRHGPIRFCFTEDILFGCMTVEECNFSSSDNPGMDQTPLALATEYVYREIFELLEARGLPHLYRVWNYLPEINAESYGLERYKQFNLGRERGFMSCHRSTAGNVPAASALGSRTGSIMVSFLAGLNCPLPIENPRQISAYHYPLQYGPQPPLFSRACQVTIGEQKVLFISGTASIVGHESLHINNARLQCLETLINIEAIVNEANRISGGIPFDMEQMLFKVYVRRPDDAPAIRHEMNRFLGFRPEAIFLQADICRRDLLVEIEAMVGHRTISAATCQID